MSIEVIQKLADQIETKIAAYATKAEAEAKAAGSVAQDTKNAIEGLSTKQRELADDILQLKQRGALPGPEEKAVESWGEQVVKSARYGDYAGGNINKLRLEIKNTVTNTVANTFSQRIPFIGGAFQPLTLEAFLPSLPATSNAIDYVRENVFTNNAAEVAEAAVKPESAITTTTGSMPISTVAHWIKISRQLSQDNTALAAYIDTRMRYGVNLRVEQQLVAGNGTSPNISGILDAGNFTAHGIADAALGATLKKLVLIRKMLAQVEVAGYVVDAILLNPDDWATIEIDLLVTSAGQQLRSVSDEGVTRLFGKRVITSIGMTADQVAVGAFGQAYTIYNREGVVVDMTDSDGTDFQSNIITLRAERRLALVTERPAAVRAGDLTPV